MARMAGWQDARYRSDPWRYLVHGSVVAEGRRSTNALETLSDPRARAVPCLHHRRYMRQDNPAAGRRVRQ